MSNLDARPRKRYGRRPLGHAGAPMPATTVKHNPFRRALRIIRIRPRLFLSALVEIAVAALWPASFHGATRVLFGWDIGAGPTSSSPFESWRLRISTGCGATRRA